MVLVYCSADVGDGGDGDGDGRIPRLMSCPCEGENMLGERTTGEKKKREKKRERQKKAERNII